MPGLRPVLSTPLKHLENYEKGIQFPFSLGKARIALKVWENLEKNQNPERGFEPSSL